jgi:hypothetical protein
MRDFTAPGGVGVQASTTRDFGAPGGIGVQEAELILVDYFVSSDVDEGTWLGEDGSATNLYSHINERLRNDATYIASASGGIEYVGGINVFITPGSRDNHLLEYCIRSDNGLPITITFVYFAGVGESPSRVVIAGPWVHDPGPSEWTSFMRAISRAQAEAISNYPGVAIVCEPG